MANVVVIGAGVVGAATAIELQRDGHRVTILEPGEPGGEQAASYGNGTLLNPSSILPMSSPGIWRKVPGWLADPLGPLAIRWRYLPRLLPWLTRFLRAGATEARVAMTARALRPLLLNAPELHRRLAEEAGVSELISRQGMLSVFPSRAEFVAEEMEWRLRRENGVRWLELSADELRQREPTLSRRYTFGVLVRRERSVSRSWRVCSGAGASRAGTGGGAAACQGAWLPHRRGAPACGADRCGRDSGGSSGDRGRGRSHVLAAAAGDRVPLETERGYHAVIADPGITPRYPVMPSDGKMACVMTPQGLRLAGQVELAGLDAAPNWRRAEVLRDFARRVFPDVPADLPASRVKVWMGHRPSTPDGLPCIGPASGCPDIVHAFGHGHVGLTAGAATGRLVADLISGRQPAIDIAPFAAQRF